MRRHVTLALAAAVALAAASQTQQAQANITMTITQTGVSADLTAAGWTGYVITFTASGNISTASLTEPETIGAADFANSNPGVLTPTGGIFGPMNQAERGTAQTTPTPSTINGTETWSTSQTNDSTFLNFGYWNGATPNPATENNGLTGSPIAGSSDQYFRDQGDVGAPDPEGTAATWSLGNSLTFSGSALGNLGTGTVGSQKTTLQTALIIAKANAGDVSIHGQVLDQTGAIFVFNQVVNAPVPEPASLGVLALGGLSLLAKRRKRA